MEEKKGDLKGDVHEIYNKIYDSDKKKNEDRNNSNKL